jgi:hypothetical protein
MFYRHGTNGSEPGDRFEQSGMACDLFVSSNPVDWTLDPIQSDDARHGLAK